MIHRFFYYSFFLFICSGVSISAQTYFEINDFDVDRDKLTILGDVMINQDKLSITPDIPQQKGACWYAKGKIDLSIGFDTEFTFLIEKNSAGKHGDGFAFVIQNSSPNAIGHSGAGLGYDGISNALVLEFDTYDNHEGSRNHVNLSVYSTAKQRFVKIATVHEIPEITDGSAHFARVEYKNGFLSFFLDSYLFPILSTKIDIAEAIGSNDHLAWMGFTAATSHHSSAHNLLNWSMNEKLKPPPDIAVEKIEVVKAKKVEVHSRKLRIRVWDDHQIDGDIISLKYNDDWIVTELKLTAEPKEMTLTLTGFKAFLTLYANNLGLMPPNTAAISIFDGKSTQKIVLNADMRTSEALELVYVGEE